jgi:hypothetical protein
MLPSDACQKCTSHKYSNSTPLLHFTYYSKNCTFYLQCIDVIPIIITTGDFFAKNNIKWFDFVMWKKSVYCAVRTCVI